MIEKKNGNYIEYSVSQRFDRKWTCGECGDTMVADQTIYYNYMNDPPFLCKPCYQKNILARRL